MRVTCKHCGGAHPAFECRKKSTEPKNMPVANGVVPVARVEPTDSAVRAKQAVGTNLNGDSQVVRRAAKSREIDGSIPSPQTKFDRKSWMREYQRSYMRNIYRPKLKASKALSSQPQKGE